MNNENKELPRKRTRKIEREMKMYDKINILITKIKAERKKSKIFIKLNN